MRSFFEEYGFILISVVVILALIGITTGASGDKGIVGKMNTSINGLIDRVGNEAGLGNGQE